MYRALYALLLLLLAGCAGIDSGSPEGSEGPPASDETVEETTKTTGETSEGSHPVASRELGSGSFTQGAARPEVRVASSAAALTEELGEKVRDRGEGTYVAALWGRKSTGGYTLKLAGARKEDGRTVIRLSLEEPPEDAMVTQAITYPYVFVFVPDATLENVSFTDQKDRELDWPVVEASG